MEVLLTCIRCLYLRSKVFLLKGSCPCVSSRLGRDTRLPHKIRELLGGTCTPSGQCGQWDICLGQAYRELWRLGRWQPRQLWPGQPGDDIYILQTW